MKIIFSNKETKSSARVVFATDGGKLLDAGKALDKSTDGAVARAIKDEKFTGEKGSTLIVNCSGCVLVVGVGQPKDLTLHDFESFGSKAVGVFMGRKSINVDVHFDFTALPAGVAVEDAAAAIAEGALLNSYRFGKYFTKGDKAKKPDLKSVTLVLSRAAEAKKIFADREKVAAGVFLTRDLVAEAPNVLYPDSYAKIIKKELAPLGVTVKILDEKQMEKLGMGALLAVGQGSARPPRLVIMEYKKGKSGKKPIAFVGKGVTFDTGGISIKPSVGMGDMKWDMGGSGTVVGLMKALAGRKAKANVIGIVPLAENMPSDRACRPGDVVTSMSGQTVEILNTDAEGRLILCDAIWYCQEKYKPSHVIDLATLTGAIIVALGHEYAGLFSNDDKLCEDLSVASKKTGENIWRMPMCEQWNKDMDSEIADVSNLSSGKGAGSATAAAFLKRFVQDGVKWAHLDIAGMAWAYREKSGVPKGASGFGVRLLDKFVADNWEK